MADTPWQRLGNRFTLGLRACPADQWLALADAFGDDGRAADQLRQKAELLDSRHSDVFAHRPDGDAASTETLRMVEDQLRLQQRPTPELAEVLHPLERAARMVPEDLLLLAPRPRHDADGLKDWVLVAAALAFPAHWVLAEKMGRPLAGIHEPVPHYGEILETPMDRFFTTMKVGPISQRWNWSVMTENKLFTPHRARRTPLAADAGIDEIFIRMEHQTLRKLGDSGCILFTIRTYIEPLTRWASMPGAAQSLADSLAGMTPQMRDYKGVAMFEEALLAHLAVTS